MEAQISGVRKSAAQTPAAGQALTTLEREVVLR
jgi:hypothetical protein